MSENMYKYKRMVAPEWYKHGDVKTFTPEEIAAYCESPQGKAGLAKVEATVNAGPDLTKFLDSLAARDAEADWKDLMKGESPREDNVKP